MQRGLQYYREGKVELSYSSTHPGPNAEELVQVVRGLVYGTSVTPYQAWASLSGQNIAEAHCSCPVGSNGTSYPRFASSLSFLVSLCLNPPC